MKKKIYSIIFHVLETIFLQSEEGTMPHNIRETRYAYELFYKPIFRAVRQIFFITRKNILQFGNIGLYNHSNTHLVGKIQKILVFSAEIFIF